MNKTRFKKIKGKYGEHASFAIWNNENLTDTKIIEKSYGELRTDIIFCGLNPNGKVRSFGNFHGKKEGRPGRGNKDIRLKKSFNTSPFRGAYMTDLFKEKKETNQNKLKISQQDLRKAFRAFTKELKMVGGKKPELIIAIGAKVYCYLLEWAHSSKFRGKIEKLPHFSSWDHKKFEKEAQKLKIKYGKIK